MKDFKSLIQEELEYQRLLILKLEHDNIRAPEGILVKRQRQNDKCSFYQRIIDSDKLYHEKNINGNTALQSALFNKELDRRIYAAASKNTVCLEKIYAQYRPNDFTDVISDMPPAYHAVRKLLTAFDKEVMNSRQYDHAPYDPKRHIHETACGLLVRSKSEVIIANALYSYEIPFHYEERLAFPDDNGKYYYPDFSIILPDRNRMWWEHLGLLNEVGYCIANGKKLYAYQRNDLLIGRNLIITQDDRKGTCSSGFIHNIIKTQILPYF